MKVMPQIKSWSPRHRVVWRRYATNRQDVAMLDHRYGRGGSQET